MLDPSHLPIPNSYPHRSALRTAIEAAQAAGALLLDIHQRGPNRIEHKSSGVDLVTEADLASQQIILDLVTKRFPDHAIHAEEGAAGTPPAHGPVWLIDPLDGTTNFAHRFPVFSVSIALWLDGQPEVGVVYDVVRGRVYWAATGYGAWMDDARRLCVSDADTLGHSLLATGFPYSRAVNPDNNLAEFSHLMPRVRGVRRAGSAALDLAWLADGRFDGYWEANLAPWDWAAGVLLVAEAGGVVTNYAGERWRLSESRMVAANPRLHATLLDAVQTARVQHGFGSPPATVL